MRPFVCMECQQVIEHPAAQLEKRIEYRRLIDQGRERVRLVGHICKGCMLAELGERSNDAQGALL